MNFLSSFPSRFLLAPMAGVTDKPFRQMVRSFGPHLIYTEMVAATSLVYNNATTDRMMDLSKENGPIAIQIVGSNPEHMAKAAVQAEKNGAFLIDINMGCPVKKLIANDAGSALMKNPVLAAEIVEHVKKHVSIPVTVKTRLGWDIDNQNILEFSKYLEEIGVDAITIHGRTKEQGYSGKADWDKIAQVKKELSIPVFANGDIVDSVSANLCLQKTNADAFLIGRAALGKPWILSVLDGAETPTNIAEIVLEHFDRLLSYYGPKGIYIARKHLAWYASGHSFVAQFRQNVYNESRPDKIRFLIKEFFACDG